MTARPILVIDDDADVREALCEALVDLGFEVAVAEHGEAALRRLRDGLRPAVILLDLMMPVMDGPQFVDALRGDAALPRIPVLVLTADPRAEQRAGGLDVEGVLRKPVSLDELDAVGRQWTAADAAP